MQLPVVIEGSQENDARSPTVDIARAVFWRRNETGDDDDDDYSRNEGKSDTEVLGDAA